MSQVLFFFFQVAIMEKGVLVVVVCWKEVYMFACQEKGGVKHASN